MITHIVDLLLVKLVLKNMGKYLPIWENIITFAPQIYKKSAILPKNRNKKIQKIYNYERFFSTNRNDCFRGTRI